MRHGLQGRKQKKQIKGQFILKNMVWICKCGGKKTRKYCSLNEQWISGKDNYMIKQMEATRGQHENLPLNPHQQHNSK